MMKTWAGSWLSGQSAFWVSVETKVWFPRTCLQTRCDSMPYKASAGASQIWRSLEFAVKQMQLGRRAWNSVWDSASKYKAKKRGRRHPLMLTFDLHMLMRTYVCANGCDAFWTSPMWIHTANNSHVPSH